MPKITTVRLDDHLAQQLEVIAEVTERSVSDTLREAVVLLVDHKREDDGFRREVGKFLKQRQQALMPLTQAPTMAGVDSSGRHG